MPTAIRFAVLMTFYPLILALFALVTRLAG